MSSSSALEQGGANLIALHEYASKLHINTLEDKIKAIRRLGTQLAKFRASVFMRHVHALRDHRSTETSDPECRDLALHIARDL